MRSDALTFTLLPYLMNNLISDYAYFLGTKILFEETSDVSENLRSIGQRLKSQRDLYGHNCRFGSSKFTYDRGTLIGLQAEASHNNTMEPSFI